MAKHSHHRASRRREKEKEILVGEIMAENFPSLWKETDILIQEAQRVPNKRIQRRPTPRLIIIKKSKVKDKERISEAAGEK